MQWDAIYLIGVYTKQVYWTMYGPFETDVVAGLISAGNMLFDELYQNRNAKEPYEFSAQQHGTDTGQQIIQHIKDLGIYKYNSPVTVDNTDRLPEKGKMAIWISNDYGNFDSGYDDWTDEQYWEFIEVDNMRNFMQGFISMCIAFQVDFREYVLDLPIDSNGVRYDIPSYGLKEYLDTQTLIDEETEEYSDD